MSSEAAWSKYHENLLKKWAEMSKTYSIMHSLCADYYSIWHKRLGVPVVIIGGVTASSIFSSNQGQDQLWTYFNGGLALIFTVLSGVSNFLGMAEKTTKHQTASYKYTKIAMDIDTMLSFARKERSMKPQEFIQSKKLAILEIRENVPEILPWVMANYLKKFDRTLTNTKSRVNFDEEKVNITPNEIINRHYDGSSSSSDTNANTYDLEMQAVPAKRIQGKTGEILSDFADRLTEKICKANEKIQSGYDSDFSTAEEGSCDCSGSEDMNNSLSQDKEILDTEEKEVTEKAK